MTTNNQLLNGRTILFLYTRLPDYFYQCITYFTKQYSCKAVIVRYPTDVNTGYEFQENVGTSFIDRHSDRFSLEAIQQMNPAGIFTGSWRDTEYKKICRYYKSRIPVIIGLDNPWEGTYKQYINSLLSSFLVRRYFNKIWVAGYPQYVYAKRLGFEYKDILRDVYSADNEKFEATDLALERYSNKTILFVGRFVSYKNPLLLASTFNEIIRERAELSDWKLVLAGRGPLTDEIKMYQGKNIEVRDFVSPERLPALMSQSAVFCLPSSGEHWGVVVHEAVLNGLPLLLSDTVYAGTKFLISGYNGYLFQTGNSESFKASLTKMMQSTPEELQLMGKRSSVLSHEIDKEKWSAALLSAFT